METCSYQEKILLECLKQKNIELLDYFIVKYPKYFGYVKKNLYKL